MPRPSLIWLVVLLSTISSPAFAQTFERVTFDDAIRRAITSNPTVQQAAAGIARAEALLQQARARTLPLVDARFSTDVVAPVTEFSGTGIIPRTQTTTSASFSVPLLTPVALAQRNQAGDQVFVSQRNADDVRRQIAVATAEAYLAIIVQRRVLELNERARDNARAHYNYANQRFEGGIGSRLNALRAQQELSTDEVRVEEARLGIRRAQEALGVLIASDGPVDAAEEPMFLLPAEAISERDLVLGRTDLQLVLSRQTAADRVANDSWRDNLPSVTALFSPQVLAPAGLFSNAQSWRGSVVFSVPVFDSGQRRALARERLAVANVIRAERENTERAAISEVRTAREAVSATERALAYARTAAAQANEVLGITDIAFREGATTNIEVIDAQRRARDTETAAAIAEDQLRRARLDVLVATGRFPPP